MNFTLNSILVGTQIFNSKGNDVSISYKGNKEIRNYFYKIIEIKDNEISVVPLKEEMSFDGRKGFSKPLMEVYPTDIIFVVQNKGKNTTINGERVKVWDEQPLPTQRIFKKFTFR